LTEAVETCAEAVLTKHAVKAVTTKKAIQDWRDLARQRVIAVPSWESSDSQGPRATCARPVQYGPEQTRGWSQNIPNNRRRIQDKKLIIQHLKYRGQLRRERNGEQRE
jgi:hypothetical protein